MLATASFKQIKEPPKAVFTLLVLYIVFELLKPQELIPGIGALKLPMLLTLMMSAVFVFGSKKHLKLDKAYTLFILFWLVVSFSFFYSTNTRAAYGSSMLLLWTGLSFVLPLPIVLYNDEKLFRFMQIWIVINTLLALVVLKHGGTGPGGYLRDENDVCLALVMALPFIYFATKTSTLTKRQKWLLTIFAGIVIAAIFITGSRGGVLGLVAVLGYFLFKSKRPIKNALLIICLAVAIGGSVIALLPDAYVADMSNMTNTEDSTADERLYSWSIAWVMFLENPILGTGAGNFAWTNHHYHELSPMWGPGRRPMGGRASHSVYFTVLPELGLLGTVIFVLIIKHLFSRCRKAIRFFKRQASSSLNTQYLNHFYALECSLIGFLVSGAFISVLYYPFLWLLLGLIAVSYQRASYYIDSTTQPSVSMNNV